MKNIIITEQMQLDIFEEVFMKAIETGSMRKMLRNMIDAHERVELANVDLMLAKLAVEIYDSDKGDDNYETI